MEKPAAASSSLWQQHLLLLYRENMLIKHLRISQYNTFMCNEVMVFAVQCDLINEWTVFTFHFRKHSQRNWKHSTQKYFLFFLSTNFNTYTELFFYFFKTLCAEITFTPLCLFLKKYRLQEIKKNPCAAERKATSGMLLKSGWNWPSEMEMPLLVVEIFQSGSKWWTKQESLTIVGQCGSSSRLLKMKNNTSFKVSEVTVVDVCQGVITSCSDEIWTYMKFSKTECKIVHSQHRH